MGSNFPKILNDALSFVVPELCFGCNAALYRGERLLCAFCRNELPLTDFKGCTENLTDRLFYGRSPVEKATALFYYTENGVVQKLIHSLKYRGQERVGIWLGQWMGVKLLDQPVFRSVNIVLPVPLHPKKKRKRGYNQSSAFGKAIAKHLGAVYSETHLYRPHSSFTQTTKNRWKRWESTRGNFCLRKKEDLEGKDILIVDDVLTTGSTLEACVHALDAVRDKRIFIAVMAVVP